MPRPRKWKKVCQLPENSLYGPIGKTFYDTEHVYMSVEEYEAIRLIDLENLTQEESADKMQVARGTVQNLYSSARKKLADSLVNGKILRIEGGDYHLYDDLERIGNCGMCRRNRCKERRMSMKGE